MLCLLRHAETRITIVLRLAGYQASAVSVFKQSGLRQHSSGSGCCLDVEMGKIKSDIWKYYKEKKENNKTTYSCIFCDRKYAKNATRMAEHLIKCLKSPNNLKKHFRESEHSSAEFSSRQGPSTAGVCVGVGNGSSSTMSQGTLLNSFLDRIGETEENIRQEKLATAIYSSGCPLSLVNNIYWKDFFSRVRPSFKLPSRNDISGKYLDEEYESVSNTVLSTVKSATSVALQCDGWTNIRNEAILNFIVTTPLPVLFKTLPTGAERHTEEYISEELLKCIEEIGSHKVVGIVSDNAAAMEKAKKIVSDKVPYRTGYSCASHTLNLFVGDIMKLQSLSSLESACKEIVKEITGSHIIQATFNKIQVDKYGSTKALKMPVKTRWGSILHCLDSLVNSKEVLQMLAISQETYFIKLTRSVRDRIFDNNIFWVRVDKIQKLLNPVVKWITILEGDEPTMSQVFVGVKEIEQSVLVNAPGLPIKSSEENELLSAFKKRKEMLLRPVHLATYLLDPNYFGSDLDNIQHIQAIQFKDILLSQHPLFLEEKNQISVELTNYLGKNELWAVDFVWTTGRRADPIAWWRGICAKTKLKNVAIALLSLPASSAATERSFSSYSFVHTKRRNKLTTERAGKLVYIRSNRKLFERKRENIKPIERENFILDTEPPTIILEEGSENLSSKVKMKTSDRGLKPSRVTRDRIRRRSSSTSTESLCESESNFSVHSSTSCFEESFEEDEG